MLNVARQKLEALMLQEECGELTEADRENTTDLERDAEYLEIFTEKFGDFLKELE